MCSLQNSGEPSQAIVRIRFNVKTGEATSDIEGHFGQNGFGFREFLVFLPELVLKATEKVDKVDSLIRWKRLTF